MPVGGRPIVLLENAGNVTGQPVAMPIDDLRIGTLYVWGTFGGATVTLECSPDPPELAAGDSEWFPVPDADAITTKTVINVQFRARKLRGVVASGTSPSITMKVVQ